MILRNFHGSFVIDGGLLTDCIRMLADCWEDIYNIQSVMNHHILRSFQLFYSRAIDILIHARYYEAWTLNFFILARYSILLVRYSKLLLSILYSCSAECITSWANRLLDFYGVYPIGRELKLAQERDRTALPTSNRSHVRGGEEATTMNAHAYHSAQTL